MNLVISDYGGMGMDLKRTRQKESVAVVEMTNDGRLH